MPSMQDSIVIANNTTTANVLAGNLFENMPKTGRITLLATGSVTGLRTTMLVGAVPFVNESAIGMQNRFPLIPDDLVGRAFGLIGAKLFLTFRNTTAGSITAFWCVIIE